MVFLKKKFKPICKLITGILLTVLNSCVATAQLTPVTLQQFLQNTSLQNELTRYEQVKEFYRAFHYRVAWINNNQNFLQLNRLLLQSTAPGLNEAAYRPGLLYSDATKAVPLATQNDSLLAELRITDAAIHFFHDAVYGNSVPAVRYNGLAYEPGCINIPVILAEALLKNNLHTLLKDITFNNPAITALQKMLVQYRQQVNANGFSETPVSSGTLSWQNRPLATRLFQLGFIDTLREEGNEKELKILIIQVQRLFALEEDSICGSKTRRAMNISLKQRIEELQTALNTYRWLGCTGQMPKLIVVNIPAARLQVYSSGQIVLQSKVVVGKRSTPTPAAITSAVTEVVAYPYWMVPKRIATRELLPLIKKNIGYLAENNLQVLNLQAKVVDPAKVNWHSLSSSHFPYVLRQSTGCDNSLGLVKLNFYNPFNVYLHDTPMKELFNENNRYFSHGCIRVEKAMDLARFVLAENRIAVDTLDEKGCLRNQKPIPVQVTEKVPVFILYSTAWPDAAGNIRFYEDVYRKVKG